MKAIVFAFDQFADVMVNTKLDEYQFMSHWQIAYDTLDIELSYLINDTITTNNNIFPMTCAPMWGAISLLNNA